MRTTLPTFAFIAVLALPAIAHANSVTYTCGSNPAVVIVDGGSADLDPSANAILVNFVCNDIDDGTGNIWSANGKIRAEYFKIAPKSAELEIYDARWVSEGPNWVNDDFKVRHNFPVIGGPDSSADIDVDLVHIGGGGFIDYVSLSTNLQIAQFIGGLQSIGGFGAFIADSVFGPVNFMDSLGPVAHLDSVAQVATMTFYLGIPNDSFQFGTGQSLFFVTEQ